MADSHRAPGFARGSRAGSPPLRGRGSPWGRQGVGAGAPGVPRRVEPRSTRVVRRFRGRCAAGAGGGVRPPGGTRPGRTVPPVSFTVCPREDFCICRCVAGVCAGARPPPIRPPGGRGRRPGAGRPRRRTGLAAARPGPGGRPVRARRPRGQPRRSSGVPAGLRHRSSDCRARMPVSKPLKRFVLITPGSAGMPVCGLNLVAGRSVRRGRRGGRANHMVGSRPFSGRRTPLPGRFFLSSGAPGGARSRPPPASWPGKSQFTG